MAGRPVGVREVAERAKVSVGTVSHVINRPDLVAPDTLARVRAVMAELGYVRNSLASQLRTGRGRTLGMIMLSVGNPFFAELAHACEAVAERSGYTIVFGSSDSSLEREARYIDLLEEQRITGLLVAPIEGGTDQLRRLSARGTHVVLFDGSEASTDFCTVAMDGVLAGRLAVEHLIATGRRRIAFAAGDFHLVRDRWLGALEACAAEPGVRLDRLSMPDHSVEDGRALGERIAAMPPDQRPDAVFAASDQVALGLLHALVPSGSVAVPKDIAIVGYDDIAYAASAIIPLTTIRQPVEQIAEQAVRLALAGAEGGEHRHERVRCPPELVVRESAPGARVRDRTR